jgi:phosphoglycerol transferase MdoB-like AlkP superfamily enzyme
MKSSELIKTGIFLLIFSYPFYFILSTVLFPKSPDSKMKGRKGFRLYITFILIILTCAFVWGLLNSY